MAALSSCNVAGANGDDVIRSCVAESSDAAVCEVRVIKGALGLGFCIEGGRGSINGDRPITVKRLFQGISYLLFIALKPNSITLAASELAPHMFGASSELAPNQLA